MGFGIKKEAGSNTTPSDIVNFDKLTPTTAGVVFDPNTPATEDILYVSSVDASTWIWNGTAYITYSPPATATTEWYLNGTSIDAGSNKTAAISRNNSIYVNFNDSFFNSVRVGRGRNNIATNTVVGNGAGNSISTGTANTFIGLNAGNANTTGGSNVYLGYGTGLNNNGASNTFLGIGAGRYLADGTTPLTLASTSVFIGGDIRASLNNQSNQIVIGHNAIGKGSNTVNIGNTSITNTYLNGAVTVNNAFTFPTTDGTANQVLKTNGSGTVTWGVAGLSFFSEAQSTTGVNATVYANSLTAVSTTASADFIIIPKGNGSIINKVPDGTATGGNKRGIKCLDLQTSITSAARIAGGTGNTILSGIDNYITSPATYSVITGGTNNAITGGTSSLVVGDSCNMTGSYSLAVGSCNVSGNASASIGGSAVSGGNSLAVGAFGTVSGTQCFATGRNYLINGFYSAGFGLGAKNYGHSTRIVNGTFTSTGGSIDHQSSWFQLAAQTTNATATLLYSYNGLNTSSIDLQNNNLMRIKGMIIGKQVSSVNSAIFDIDVTVVRGATAGTVAILGTPSISLVVNTGGFGTPTITTSSSGIDFKVIGLLATDIRWSCRLDTVEVIA
jgi:hypothetical protein